METIRNQFFADWIPQWQTFRGGSLLGNNGNLPAENCTDSVKENIYTTEFGMNNLDGFFGRMVVAVCMVATLMFGGALKAGQVEYNLPVDRVDLSNGNIYVLHDPTWADEASNPTDYASMRENQVRLVYSRDERSDLDGNKWEYSVTYTVFFIGQNLASVQNTLTIAHGPGTHDYAAVDVYKPGAHTIYVRIDAIQITSLSGWVPDDIRLELATVTERYQRMDVGTSPSAFAFDANSQTLSWAYVAGAESYDVEWSWIDDAIVTPVTDPWERAVRVNVSGQSYMPNLSYRAGKVYFRVRAVGRFIDIPGEYNHRRYGEWTSPINWIISGADLWEEERNLTYMTTFAEDGKFKKVMSYVDGTGRQRQTLTHLSSDGTTVVAQTEYDHEGRGVVTTIPSPLPGIDLGYVPGLNITDGLVGTFPSYNREHFDNRANPIAKMDLQSGAARYFSDQNNIAGIHQGYIPDAGGFPFSQVEYMRDGTGRISRQGGVGADHKLNSGHEVKFFYANATPTELHQMFGGNVGNASHYLKKMSVDPNGQVSFAWQDQEERVVATALAGDAPANLQELDDMPTNFIVATLPAGTPFAQGNVLNVLNHAFPNEQLGKDYFFEWDLVGAVDKILCDICYGCKYYVDVEVRDPAGDLVTLNQTSPTTLSATHLHQEVSAQGGCPPYSSAGSLDFNLHAGLLGDYHIYKTLTVAAPDPAALASAIEANRSRCTNYTSFSDIEAGLIGAIDYGDCEQEPCSTVVPIYNDSDPKRRTSSGSTTIPCNPVFTMTPSEVEETECGGIYQAMVNDIAPGGWLHDAGDWAIIGNDPAQIEDYLLNPTALNGGNPHREACHYRACLEDAESRLWDLQMAASPDYAFAVTHHYIPTTNSVPDLWDPWFNVFYFPGPQNQWDRPAQDMLDLLFAAYQPLSTTVGMVDYYSNTNNAPQLIQDAYTTQCANSSNPTACVDQLHWQFTVGAYLAAKNDMQIDYMINERGCPYYSDGHAIVHLPTLPAQATSNHTAYYSAQMASECNTSCAGSVASWMGQLEGACPDLLLPANAQHWNDLRAALLDFCLGTCQDGNPQALLTDTYLNNGALDDVADILDLVGCSSALAATVITDPYAYDDGNGNVYEEPCTLWDPALIAILDEVSANWPHPITSLLPMAGNAVLQNAFPTASAFKFDGGGTLLLQTANPCTAIELVDGVGNFVDINTVKVLRYAEYSGAYPGIYPGTLDFQNTKVEAVIPISTAPYEQLVPVWVYSDNGCTGGFTVTQDVCSYPQMSGTGGLAGLTTFPADPMLPCSTQLQNQATYNATLIYQAQMADLVAQAIAEATALCRQKPPMSETFTMRHLPKVYQYTLYYYDQAGSLVRTIPPEGVELLDEATAHRWDNGIGNRATDMPQHRMPTTYAYNSLGQMRKSSTPDGGDKRMWYNGKDQVRLSQDARQNPNGDFAYVKYDELGRTLESGECVNCSTAITQAVLDDRLFPERQYEVLRDITTTYYDEAYDPTFSADNLRTRVAAATREDAEGDFVTTQVYDYDDHGNVRKTRTYLVGFGNFELEYQYDLISGKVNRANYQKGKPDYFAHRYSYDGDNRLTKAETTRDNVFWDRDGRYFYYPHGPLARLEIGQDNVQGQDHYYSIHGWIKGVNMPGAQDGTIDPGLDGEIASSANDDKWVGRDAMAYTLGFYATDYNPIGSVQQGVTAGIWGDLSQHILSLPGLQSAGLYNGNIPVMVTDLKKASIGSSFIGGPIVNAYQYDQLNRLKQDKTYHRNGNGWTRFPSGTPGVTYGLWDNGYTYDRNGNIETLQRSVPDVSAGLSSRTLDNLTYNYSGGANKVDNRLNSVVDLEPIPTMGDPGLVGSVYTYDAIGNLIADQNEKIAQIDWDLHNKVRAVHRTANSTDPELAFWYDGTGNRIHKRVTLSSGAVKDEWYVRDPQGNEMAVYERQVEDGWFVTRCKEHPIYGADRLGIDLNGVEISRYAIGDEDPKDPTGDPSGRHALVIGEILYDSPKTGDDFPTGKEYNEGEYVVLINKSGLDLDLSEYTLRVDGDSLVLTDSLAAGERMIVGFGESAADFAQLVPLPTRFAQSVKMQASLRLPDRGGVVSVAHSSGAVVDEFSYGSFYGLSAENGYLADTLYDSLSRRSSLKSVQRESYGGPISIGGVVVGDAAGVGDIDPGIDPEPIEKAVWGKYTLHRGRKVYELKNHLGNVLAVVSDVKIGKGILNVMPIEVLHYVADIVEMTDYEPFGMQLANRHYVSGDGYRFGFNGKEADDEWKGEGNMYNYGFRIHDPRLGRFLSVDPLAPDFPMLSSYQYASNSPIAAIDLDGLESQWNTFWNAPGSGVQAPQALGQPAPSGIGTNLNDQLKNTETRSSSIGQQSTPFSNEAIGISAYGACEGIFSEVARREYNLYKEMFCEFDGPGRTELKGGIRKITPPISRAYLNWTRPGLGARPGSVGGARRTNGKYNTGSKILGIGGTGLALFSVGASIYNVSIADDKSSAAWHESGSFVGGVVGGYVGAEIGAIVPGPLGFAAAFCLGIEGGQYGSQYGREVGPLLGADQMAKGLSDYNASFPSSKPENLVHHLCFEQGTLVSTPSGFVPIEDIKVGHTVINYDESSKELGIGLVVRCISSEVDKLLVIRTGGESIVVTSEHPFYVLQKGWVVARQLQSGDELLSFKSGKNGVIKEIEAVVRHAKVFNIEVDKNHNYLISKEKLLVHNKNVVDE